MRDLEAAGAPEPLADAIVTLWASTQETGSATRRDLDAGTSAQKRDIETLGNRLDAAIAAQKHDLETLDNRIDLLSANIDTKFECLQKTLMIATVAVMFTFIGGAISIIAKLPIRVGP